MSGNVFKDTEGNNRTGRIQLKDITPTIVWLESITNLPLEDNKLGSVGKKQSSGDIDLAVDSNKFSKDQLVNTLTTWAAHNNHALSDCVKKSGISVHFKTPIAGNLQNGYVQTDFMFGNDIEFMKFSLYSAGDVSKFTGGQRNLLMSSIAKSINNGATKYSWQRGLIERSSGNLVTKNPLRIARYLLGQNCSDSDLNSVESIMHTLLQHSRNRIDDIAKLAEQLKLKSNKKVSEIKADLAESARIDDILKFYNLS